MTELAALRRDLADVEARLEALHKRYLHTVLVRGVTRAQTTTYNARAAQLCEQRDALRRSIKEVDLDLSCW
ncbi:MAG: hypothetical protein WC455_16125 [Dehalococcoidia bacterium]|jgi:hypothetical protein